MSALGVVEGLDVAEDGEPGFISRFECLPPDEDGNYVHPNQVLTYLLHGDLEGIYVMTGAFYGNIYSPHYTFAGQATFTWWLKGKASNWSATVKISGKMHAGYEFAGKERWKVTLCSPKKGQITVHDRFGHFDGTDYSVYTGELK
jgi:hypothetical protein